MSNTKEPSPDSIEPIKFDSFIDINSIPVNSLLLFRVKELNDGVYAAIKNLQNIYGASFHEKGISFLILKPETSLELVKPGHLESLGWIRKEKNIIIH